MWQPLSSARTASRRHFRQIRVEGGRRISLRHRREPEVAPALASNAFVFSRFARSCGADAPEAVQVRLRIPRVRIFIVARRNIVPGQIARRSPSLLAGSEPEAIARAAEITSTTLARAVVDSSAR